MSKLTKQQEELEVTDLFDDEEMSDDDYVFVIGPNGELKSVLLPDNEELSFNPPEQIKQMLAVYDIADIDQFLEPRVLH